MKTLLKTPSLNINQIPKKLNLKCENLFFNLINKVFKKNSFDNKILDNDEITSLMTIFSKKGEKTEEEINLILSYLNKIDYFTKIDLEDQIAREKCIKALRLKGYSQGDTIVKVDDEGNSLILVLYGTVSRQIVTPYTGYMLARDYINYLYKVKNEEKNEKKLKRLEEYNKSKDSLIKTSLLQTLNYDMKNVTFDVNFYGEFILEKNLKTEVYKGKDIIGEKSFLNKNMNNEISHLIAENDCVVIILDKKDYMKIIEDMNNFKINNLSKKLKENFQIFKNWNKMQISKLIYYLKKIVLKKDQILYTQNSPPDNIYFIFQGKLENNVSLDIKKHCHFCDFINSKSDYFLSQLKKTSLDRDSELFNKLSKKCFNQ
jgi:CRP-like cAMP-binding protein